MDEEALNSRLSRISTLWTMLGKAHRDLDAQAGDARLALIQRYQGAAYRYLLGALRDPDAADELFQEFALRVLQGAFARADPRRGRFRDYLKTTLYHLIVDHQKRQRRAPRTLDPEVLQPAAPPWDPADSEEQFFRSWRDDLLARAWAQMAQLERQRGQPYYSVLKFRAEHPEVASAEMAARLTEQLCPQRPLTDTAVRKLLQRARGQFADLLLDDVAHSLGEATIEQLEQELIELDLLSYCRSALARRKGQRE